MRYIAQTQNMSIMVEGEYGSDKYDGTNSESLAAHLEDVIIALGTVDSINLASATVTAKTFRICKTIKLQ